MNNYPIEGLMNTAMNSIKEMVDVNTIIGEPIETSNNVVIIPVSKVNFGFAAGGSEFKIPTNNDKNKSKDDDSKSTSSENSRLPFGGGSGAGVSISPIAFIAIQPTGVKLLPVTHSSSLDKLLDFIPDLVEKTSSIIDTQLKKLDNKKDSSVTLTLNDLTLINAKVTKESSTPPIKNNTNVTASEVVKKESKPYDIEYDETSSDM